MRNHNRISYWLPYTYKTIICTGMSVQTHVRYAVFTNNKKHWEELMRLYPCSSIYFNNVALSAFKYHKFHYRVHKSTPLGHIFVHSFMSILLKSNVILSSHLSLGFRRGLFHTGFPTKNLEALLISVLIFACPTHPTFPDLNKLITFSR